jgi:hypothetical protein
MKRWEVKAKEEWVRDHNMHNIYHRLPLFFLAPSSPPSPRLSRYGPAFAFSRAVPLQRSSNDTMMGTRSTRIAEREKRGNAELERRGCTGQGGSVKGREDQRGSRGNENSKRDAFFSQHTACACTELHPSSVASEAAMQVALDPMVPWHQARGWQGSSQDRCDRGSGSWRVHPASLRQRHAVLTSYCPRSDL